MPTDGDERESDCPSCRQPMVLTSEEDVTEGFSLRETVCSTCGYRLKMVEPIDQGDNLFPD